MIDKVRFPALAVLATGIWVWYLDGGQADEKARAVQYFKTYSVEQTQTAVKKSFKGTVRLAENLASYEWLQDPHFVSPDRETLLVPQKGVVAAVVSSVFEQLNEGKEAPISIVTIGHSAKSKSATLEAVKVASLSAFNERRNLIVSGAESALIASEYRDLSSHNAPVLAAKSLTGTLLGQDQVTATQMQTYVEFRAPQTWSYALNNPYTKFFIEDRRGVGNLPASIWKYGVEQSEDVGGYLVFVRLNDPDRSLKSGEQLTVTAQVPMSWSVPKAPSIPRSSIKTRSDGSTSVMVVTLDEGEIFAKETRVRILNSAGSRHQVAGLPRGTTLIAEKVDQIEDGQLLIDFGTISGRPHSEEFLLKTFLKY